MKKIILSYLVFISILPFSYSQKLIIEDTLNLKKGIYKNFEEFKFNSPSIFIDFTVKEKKINNYIQYKPEASGHNFNKDSIWGFCDGKNVYIRLKDNGYGIYVYEKIHYLGRYCYFTYYTGMASHAARKGGIIGTAIAYNSNDFDYKVLNFNNGQIFYLIKNNLEVILKKDPELFDQYNADEDKKKKYVYYLVQYSLKHQDEIKR